MFQLLTTNRHLEKVGDLRYGSVGGHHSTNVIVCQANCNVRHTSTHFAVVLQDKHKTLLRQVRKHGDFCAVGVHLPAGLAGCESERPA
jgi:hypothetical protein